MNDCMPITCDRLRHQSQHLSYPLLEAFYIQIQCHLYIGWFAQATVDINHRRALGKIALSFYRDKTRLEGE